MPPHRATALPSWEHIQPEPEAPRPAKAARLSQSHHSRADRPVQRASPQPAAPLSKEAQRSKVAANRDFSSLSDDGSGSTQVCTTAALPGWLLQGCKAKLTH